MESHLGLAQRIQVSIGVALKRVSLRDASKLDYSQDGYAMEIEASPFFRGIQAQANAMNVKPKIGPCVGHQENKAERERSRSLSLELRHSSASHDI